MLVRSPEAERAQVACHHFAACTTISVKFRNVFCRPGLLIACEYVGIEILYIAVLKISQQDVSGRDCRLRHTGCDVFRAEVVVISPKQACHFMGRLKAFSMSVMFKVLLGAGAMSDELGKMAKRKSEILNTGIRGCICLRDCFSWEITCFSPIVCGFRTWLLDQI